MITRVRGTRDIFKAREFLEIAKITKKHLDQYRFTQVILPSLESVELFKRALGQETDVVSKEMFVVSSSSADQKKEQICLRPEATAQMVRAFIENGVQDLPWKVFCIGSMFRYERPQKGRFREFYQCSLEVIGSASISEDIHLITMLDTLFSQKFNLTEYALHINFLGCPEDRKQFKQKLYDFLNQHESAICDTCKKRKEANILRVFDCKSQDCHKVYKDAPHLTDDLCQACATEWQQVQDRLEELSVSFVHNTKLVRGLDYYNKTIFEFVSPLLGAQSAFCGGGRYDSLVTLLGGKKDQPAIGAAIGLDRLDILLAETNSTLLEQQLSPLYVILPLEKDQHPIALKLAQILHTQGFCVDVLFDGSIKNMMRKSNKMGAQAVLLLGSDEQAQGTVMFKDMQSGESQAVKQIDVSGLMKK
ncbi:MAG: histidyl-tRNA synthetase [Alteromonas naphthalenivorans]|jgi:histidyl-tRNA synthetase